LIAAGRLRAPATPRRGALDVAITVRIGEAALSVEENLNPVPGGLSAGSEWTLHLPAAGALDQAPRTALVGAAHLSCDPPPPDARDQFPGPDRHSPLRGW
jgi:hypothetical protein